MNYEKEEITDLLDTFESISWNVEDVEWQRATSKEACQNGGKKCTNH